MVNEENTGLHEELWRRDEIPKEIHVRKHLTSLAGIEQVNTMLSWHINSEMLENLLQIVGGLKIEIFIAIVSHEDREQVVASHVLLYIFDYEILVELL